MNVHVMRVSKFHIPTLGEEHAGDAWPPRASVPYLFAIGRCRTERACARRVPHQCLPGALNGVGLHSSSVSAYASARCRGTGMGSSRTAGLRASFLACPLFIMHFLPAVAQERPPEFEEMYQRGLALYEAGKYAEAIPIAEQYLALAAARYGEQHLWYATGLGYLAILHQAQDRFADAEPQFKRALAIAENALGTDHVKVADLVSGLADLYEKLARYSEAEALLKRALAIREKALGVDHLNCCTA
jgi:tetratricopeptide (TPR) repeat protein